MLVTTSDGENITLEMEEIGQVVDNPEMIKGNTLDVEDNEPLSITVLSEGHEPVQITVNRVKKRKREG